MTGAKEVLRRRGITWSVRSRLGAGTHLDAAALAEIRIIVERLAEVSTRIDERVQIGGARMKVTGIDTVEAEHHENLLWVQVHTDEGLVGLGETFRNVGSVADYIHHTVAPYLIGQDPLAIQRHFAVLNQGMSTRTIGSEMRALSAIDIALWDLFGQSVDLPIHRCLGGPVRDNIRIYNTCAGSGYNSGKAAAPGQPHTTAWGLERSGRFEDLRMWLLEGRAGELARSLLESGITAMKIWPFDQFADETGGEHITPWQLEQALQPYRDIRDAVGMEMEIAVELHSEPGFGHRYRSSPGRDPPDVVRGSDLDGRSRYARYFCTVDAGSHDGIRDPVRQPRVPEDA